MSLAPVGARRALVTGAAGFVGANLTRRLLADGHEVVAVVAPGTDDWRLAGVDRVELRQADLTNRGAPAALLDAVRPAWVFHLAAHGAYSWQQDSARILQTNVIGAQAVIEAAGDAGCESLVLAGSSSEYGIKGHAPDEDEALTPNSVYAAAKAAATMLAMHAANAGPGPVITVLRLYSVYGPFEDPGRLIPRLLSGGLEGDLPDLADSSIARDFVAVNDVIDAFLLAASRPHKGDGAIYNVGTGTQTTLGEVVALTRRLLGVAAEPRWGTAQARAWDAKTWVADPARIGRELGWRPRISLELGLTAMADWLREAEPAVRTRYSEGN